MIKIKENHGITLIALVITVMTILIVAGVTLNIMTRGNIIENANNAVDKYNKNSGDAQNLVNEADSLLNQYTTEGSSGGTSTPTPNKIEPTITLVCEDITYGESAPIIIFIDATGSVDVDIVGVGYDNSNTIQIIDGKAEILIPNLYSGDYTVYVYYEGDNNYLPSNASDQFSVTSANPAINIDI